MSDSANLERRLESMLEGSMRLQTQQSLETNKKLEVLATSVQQLVETSIKAEERHKQYDERFERMEGNQKIQGSEIKDLSDGHISVIKDLESHSSFRSFITKIGTTIAIAMTLAAMSAIYGIST